MMYRNDPAQWTRRAFGSATSALVALGLLLLAAPVWATGLPCLRNPIIFVHGGSGSGNQFESQAMRFNTNGYPLRLINVLEYDSGNIDTILPDVLARLDDLIAELQDRTNCEQVDLLGHSLGTVVSQAYLGTAERAANVAHYVNIDGRPADAPPGGVPTLALWAGAARPVQGEIVGAINVTIPDQEHVEVASSEESFVEMFQFFRGHPPLFRKIRPSPILSLVSGRAVIFPANVGVDGATVEVYKIDPDTGERMKRFPWEQTVEPVASFAIDETGDFGPFIAFQDTYYELALLRDGVFTHHFFFEPFIRSTRLVRLNTSLPGAGIDFFLPKSANHTTISVARNREFWGDRGADNDVIAIDGTNVINATTAPSGFVGAAAAIFAFDFGLDQMSNVNSVPPPFSLIPFLTAADLYIPTDPPGTVSVEVTSRGDPSTTRTINVRNIPSTEGRVSIQLPDFK